MPEWTLASRGSEAGAFCSETWARGGSRIGRAGVPGQIPRTTDDPFTSDCCSPLFSGFLTPLCSLFDSFFWLHCSEILITFAWAWPSTLTMAHSWLSRSCNSCLSLPSGPLMLLFLWFHCSGLVLTFYLLHTWLSCSCKSLFIPMFRFLQYTFASLTSLLQPLTDFCLSLTSYFDSCFYSCNSLFSPFPAFILTFLPDFDLLLLTYTTQLFFVFL